MTLEELFLTTMIDDETEISISTPGRSFNGNWYHDCSLIMSDGIITKLTYNKADNKVWLELAPKEGET